MNEAGAFAASVVLNWAGERVAGAGAGAGENPCWAGLVGTMWWEWGALSGWTGQALINGPDAGGVVVVGG